MPTNLFVSESKFIERARTALANAQTNPLIKAALNDYGMGDEQLIIGQQIFDGTLGTRQSNIQEDAETTEASLYYKTTYQELQAIFKVHRDKALIFLKKQPELLAKLGVQGRFPQKYNDFFDKVRQFYSSIKNDAELQAVFNRIKLTVDVIDECMTLLDELLAKRSDFDRELAESQDMTKNKNAALLALKDWMEDFDAIAKVALYDKPQLLEALGIFVRS